MAAALVALGTLAAASCAKDPARSNGTPPAWTGDPLDSEVIRAVVGRVADWQLEHPRYEPTDWTNAVFYPGLLAAHRLTGEPRYLETVIAISERAQWRIGERYRHADDHAIAQTYLELYRLRGDARSYADFRGAIERMKAQSPDWPKEHQVVDYWWCDALFMSPPAIAMLAAATGESSYLELLDRLWRESYDLLFDREQRLFHRDLRFRSETRPRYWARGNGWVLAGLARLLDELPEDRESRAFYEGVFRDLGSRLVELQGADGLWRSDLLDESPEATGETSGTALICFALAWGMRSGVLDPDRYLDAVTTAWRALAGNVNEAGRLGRVQKPGVKPGRVSTRRAEAYASGAFLLAAEQMVGLNLDGGDRAAY